MKEVKKNEGSKELGGCIISGISAHVCRFLSVLTRAHAHISIAMAI